MCDWLECDGKKQKQNKQGVIKKNQPINRFTWLLIHYLKQKKQNPPKKKCLFFISWTTKHCIVSGCVQKER